MANAIWGLITLKWISLVAMSSLEMSYFECGVYCVKGRVERLPRLLSRLQEMRPSLSYYISYVGIEGALDEELTCANNEIFFDYDPLREYEALSKSQLPSNPSFYLLAPSAGQPGPCREGIEHPLSELQSPLCLQPELGR